MRLIRLIKRHSWRRLLIFVLLVIFVLSSIQLWRYFSPPIAEAAWFDDSYAYRLKVTFTHDADISAERAVTFTLDTAELVTASLMQSDCDDTRFTDGNGLVLKYDLTGTCDNASTTYEVIFPSVVNGSNLFYVYYANPAANNAEIDSTGYTALTPSGGDPSDTAPTSSDEQGQTPISYWNFDEATGTTTNDVTLQNNDLTITGATWRTSDLCVFDNCLQFDGSNDNAAKTYSSDTELDPGTDSLTITGWFKHTHNLTGTDTIIGRFSSGGYKIYTSSSGLCFGIDNDGTSFPSDSACTTTTYADSSWHHLAAVKSTTSSITLYVDGAQVGTDTSITASSISGSSPTIVIGDESTTATTPWDGFIDEVKYYNFAKTAAQILAEYSSKSNVKGATATFGSPNALNSLSNGLLGYWSMEESAANSCGSSNDTCDTSGNGHQGDWNGDATTTNGKFGRGTTYDGTGDYITFAPGEDITELAGGTAMTVSVWIRPSFVETEASRHFVLGISDTAQIYFNENQDDFTWNGNTSGNDFTFHTSSLTWTSGTWHHIVGTYSSTGGAKIYWDGILSASDANASGTIGTNTDTLISDSANPWLGVLDEVRVYNRALSGAEVEALYAFAPGPVGHWKLDENTGTSANDSSGNDNTGTLTNSPTWTTGKFGSGVTFAGSNQHIIRADDSDFDFGTAASFSYGTWVKHDTASATELVMVKYDNTAGNGGFSLQMESDGDLTCGIDDDEVSFPEDSATSTAATYDDNVWHHVSCVKDGTTGLYLYIDGVLITSDASISSTGDFSNADPLYIGIDSDGTSNDFVGSLDDVRIYNYARTSKQIVEDMNAGHPAGGSPIGSQVMYWKLDEQQGSTTYDSANITTENGTTASTVWLLENSCKINGCINVNNGSDNVSAGNTLTFANSATAMTWTVWLNPQTITVLDSIISKTDTSTAANHAFYISTSSPNSDEILVQVGDGADTSDSYNTSDFDLVTGSWIHLAVVYDGSESAANRIRVYKNGQLKSGTVTGTIPTSMIASTTTNLKIGASDSGGSTGLVSYYDEVKIYTGALSQAEILVDMNAGSSVALGGVLGTHDNEGFSGDPPVGWWKFDENSASTTQALDTSGNDNTLTLNSMEATDWGIGRFGTGLTLDGSAEYLSRADDADFDPGTGSFSVSAWVKHNGVIATDPDYIITKADTTIGGYKLWMDNSGDFCFAIEDDGAWAPVDTACTSAVDYDDDAWHHIVGVKDVTNDDLNLFVDGRKVAIDGAISDGATLSNGDPLYVGSDRAAPVNTWDGTIDDARYYNYALTMAQVNYVYNRGAPFAWYKLDECSGSTAYNSAVNSSGATAGLNGTITAGSGGSNTSIGSCSSGTSTEMWYNGTTGKRNASLDFDGDATAANADTIDMGDQSQFNVRDNEGFTVEAWFSRDLFTTADVIASKRADTTDPNSDGWHLQITASDRAEFSVGDGVSGDFAQTPTTLVQDSNWHHAVGVFDPRSGGACSSFYICLYYDGVLYAGSTASGGDPADPAISMQIGSESDEGNAFDGQIDEVKLYSYPFSATQAKKAFNDGAQRFGPLTGSP